MNNTQKWKSVLNKKIHQQQQQKTEVESRKMVAASM